MSGEVAQRGHLTWPKIPLIFCVFVVVVVFCFICFPFLILIENLFLPLKFKRHYCLFVCVSLCFSLALFWPLPFSRSLSLPVSCTFSFFLPSCFSCQFLGFAFCFCFVCVFLQDVLLFLFFCLLFCFVWNHYIIFVLASHLVFFLVVIVFGFALMFCYFLIFGYLSKTSQKYGNSKTPKNEKCREKGHFDKSN